MSKSSLEAAAEAAAKVNAMLIAKGKLKLPANQVKPKLGTLPGEKIIIDDLITAEVEINNAPLAARNLLTKGHTQDEICKYSGAAISTRGRYVSCDDQLKTNAGDRPLYLHIQASSKESVDLAVSRILNMISQYDKSAALKLPITNSVVPAIHCTSTENIVTVQAISSSGLHFVQEKVFIGLETPASFPIRDRILGPNGSFLQHIKTETGANVTLRGRGSSFIEPTSGREAFEPLYIHLTHPKQEGLQAAKALALNLVDTVHSEFAVWQQQQQSVVSLNMPPPQIMFQQVLPGQENGHHSVSHVPSEAFVNNASFMIRGVPPNNNSVMHPPFSLPSFMPPPRLNSTFNPISTMNSSPVNSQHTFSAPMVPTEFSSHSPNLVPRGPPQLSCHPNTTMIPPLQHMTPSVMAPLQTGPPNIMQNYLTPIVHNMGLSMPSNGSSPRIRGNVQQHKIQNFHPPVVFNPNGAARPASFNPLLQECCPAPPVMIPPPCAIPDARPHGNGITTSYPHLNYNKPPVQQLEQMNSALNNKRKFTEEPDAGPDELINPGYCLQDRQVHQSQFKLMLPPPMPPTINPLHRQQQSAKEKMAEAIDHELMPPPTKNHSKSTVHSTSRKEKTIESDSKRLQGALGGIASIYDSDDSDDEVTASHPSLKN